MTALILGGAVIAAVLLISLTYDRAMKWKNDRGMI
jgi:hypothetical protein